MKTQIKQWGNSQGIRISKDLLNAANISVDDLLDVQVSDGVIMLLKTFRHRTLEERTAEYNGDLKLDGEFDWGEPVGREVW
ncbi:MAG: AbrB/MazE/SpoVT family DNA-binding domain-containing protein [Dorea sp.]|nr:AbrB/MazE/SpoVT family DNA-binding domain-containing protein [Dorea sp.]